MREIAPDTTMVRFRAVVVEGRDSAVHNGFSSREEAERWAQRIASKITANQRNVAKYGGRYPYES